MQKEKLKIKESRSCYLGDKGNPKVCQLSQEMLGEKFGSVKGGCKSMQTGRTGHRAVSVSF